MASRLPRLLLAAKVNALTLLLAGAAAGDPGRRGELEPARSVVFVCEHGNVKSLIASEWFNRLAAERGLEVRATYRGVSPEATVPAPIAAHLVDDGFDVRGFRPRQFGPSDLAGAVRIVVIGTEPPSFSSRGHVRVERWDGVPPASENYSASRDVLRTRIGKLLDELARNPAR